MIKKIYSADVVIYGALTGLLMLPLLNTHTQHFQYSPLYLTISVSSVMYNLNYLMPRGQR